MGEDANYTEHRTRLGWSATSVMKRTLWKFFCPNRNLNTNRISDFYFITIKRGLFTNLDKTSPPSHIVYILSRLRPWTSAGMTRVSTPNTAFDDSIKSIQRETVVCTWPLTSRLALFKNKNNKTTTTTLKDRPPPRRCVCVFLFCIVTK